MKCPEREQPYYKAFFEEVPPDHIYVKVKKDFKRMMEQFKSDVLAKFSAEIPNNILEEGLICGLTDMRERGAEMPNIYFSSVKIATRSVKVASERIRALLKREEDKQRAKDYEYVSEEDLELMKGEHQQVRARLMVELERCIQVQIRAGETTSEAKVKGFCDLMNLHKNAEGYVYALIGFFLPNDLGIYFNPRVVDAMNAHPSFRSMERTSVPGPMVQNLLEIVK